MRGRPLYFYRRVICGLFLWALGIRLLSLGLVGFIWAQSGNPLRYSYLHATHYVDPVLLFACNYPRAPAHNTSLMNDAAALGPLRAVSRLRL